MGLTRFVRTLNDETLLASCRVAVFLKLEPEWIQEYVQEIRRRGLTEDITIDHNEIKTS
ncbi:sporulation histidine kinase inhibitor Sda [Ammoniphilus sp. CFH 90114]|uniref:sporulation histidine kinase inhibitor Sda n=1 Tax=Ammoniphilus sp. CFH 90114 TaxID=2493665 RepID=UPI0013E93014|nr:sporulation histidine kinase inhibitor Sda [Ammoniphilus sp. CFH 90114]